MLHLKLSFIQQTPLVSTHTYTSFSVLSSNPLLLFTCSLTRDSVQKWRKVGLMKGSIHSTTLLGLHRYILKLAVLRVTCCLPPALNVSS